MLPNLVTASPSLKASAFDNKLEMAKWEKSPRQATTNANETSGSFFCCFNMIQWGPYPKTIQPSRERNENISHHSREVGRIKDSKGPAESHVTLQGRIHQSITGSTAYAKEVDSFLGHHCMDVKKWDESLFKTTTLIFSWEVDTCSLDVPRWILLQPWKWT